MIVILFGWNGTYLSYNNVYFRNGRIGIGDSNPGSPLEIVRQGSGSQLFADFRDGRWDTTELRLVETDHLHS